MEKKLQNPIVICVLALLCCALWGSAFPCIKIGYEWMEIEGIGSQILFAGYRFFLSGVLTFALGCLLERRILRMKRENFGVIFRQGVLQTTIQYVCFYIGLAHTTGAKGSIINASNAFVSIVAAHYMIRSERMTWKKGLGCILGLAGTCQSGTGRIWRRLPFPRGGNGAALHDCIRRQHGVAENDLRPGKSDDDHGISDVDRKRAADRDRMAASRRCRCVHMEIRGAFVLYGAAFDGGVQSVDTVIKI